MDEIEPKAGEYIELDEKSREMASRYLTFIESSVKDTNQATAEASRWLLASLLAVNGGALIAALGSAKIASSAMEIAGPAWLLGIALALVVGVMNVLAGLRSARVLMEYVGTLGASLVTDMLKVPDWEGDNKRLTKYSFWPWLAGCGSFGCFVVGAVAVGINLLNPAPTNPALQTTKPNLETSARSTG